MKTIKRAAKVGEDILIVREIISAGLYKTGDVLEVTEVHSTTTGSVTANTADGEVFVVLAEYEVVINKFRVGDLVAPLPDSERTYVYTTPSNNFVGEVTEVWDNGDITVSVVQSRQNAPFKEYRVCGKYFREAVPEDFKTAKATTCTMPADSTTVVNPSPIEKASMPSDAVAHPSHYTNGKFEVIEVIEEFTQGYKPYEAYCVGNVIKYVARAPHKHDTPLEDLRKARQYLDFAIKRIEAQE